MQFSAEKGQDLELYNQSQLLTTLTSSLLSATTLYQKLDILDTVVEEFDSLFLQGMQATFFSSLSPECQYVIKAYLASGQDPSLLLLQDVSPKEIERVRTLISELLSIEKAYQEIGGIVGYQKEALRLMCQPKKAEEEEILPPKWIDISQDNEQVRKTIYAAIEMQGQLAEIYPIGGVADRLRLLGHNNEHLPAAKLVFRGKELLEGLIRDLEAREHLHYKLFGKKVCTPIVIMTSDAKNNHTLIRAILEENHYFHRPKDHFFLFSQPLVPVMDKEGKWCETENKTLLLRPGGHGVLWREAIQQGIFSALYALGKSHALVRQINNPIAGTDYGLLAFMGYGLLHQKAFGMASCDRVVGSKEGINIFKIFQKEEKKFGAFTNIEYCTFQEANIQDVPKPGSKELSTYPSNTNILFVQLKEIEDKVKNVPFPGFILNFRPSHYRRNGKQITGKATRLESLMQNISEAFAVEVNQHPSDKIYETCPSYLTYYPRRKTISVTKRPYEKGKNLLETPLGCFFDQLENAYELLQQHCHIELPSFPTLQEFLDKGAPILLHYCPSLGPIFSIIGQKIQKGKLTYGSEMDLEIRDLLLHNFSLSGSLVIEEQGIAQSSKQGRCFLKHVKIENQGYQADHLEQLWKSSHHRHECLSIFLQGESEFFAEGVTFQGDLQFVVPDGTRMIITEQKGQLHVHQEPLVEINPIWQYHICKDTKKIELKR